MKKEQLSSLRDLLSDYKKENIDLYIGYLEKLFLEKKKQGSSWVSKNAWIFTKDLSFLISAFKIVENDGLTFDGKHITLQNTGVSYDYVAYKNKMLTVYPETLIDTQLVYKGESFSYEKENGKILYKYSPNNPFEEQKELDIIGAFCVIKNKRGEFITTLSKDEIVKHRKVAKTDYIWQAWYKEMVLKTVVKKACKVHFDDMYTQIELIDEKNFDLTKLQNESPDIEKVNNSLSLEKIENTKSIDGLTKVYSSLSKEEKNDSEIISALKNKKSILLKK